MQVLEKRSFEQVRYDIDCSSLLAAGETINSVISCVPDEVTTPALACSGMTISGVAIAYADGHTAPIGTVVQVQISGGTVPTGRLFQIYTIRLRVATSLSNQVEATVLLRLQDSIG